MFQSKTNTKRRSAFFSILHLDSLQKGLIRVGGTFDQLECLLNNWNVWTDNNFNVKQYIAIVPIRQAVMYSPSIISDIFPGETTHADRHAGSHTMEVIDIYGWEDILTVIYFYLQSGHKSV